MAKKFELTPALKTDLDYTVRDLLMAYATDPKLPDLTLAMFQALQVYCFKLGYLANNGTAIKITAKGKLALDAGQAAPERTRLGGAAKRSKVDNSLPIRFNRLQQAIVDQLVQDYPEISWHIERLQGTGLRFWRIHFTPKPEWQGDLMSFDGKTLNEVITKVRNFANAERYG